MRRGRPPLLYAGISAAKLSLLRLLGGDREKQNQIAVKAPGALRQQRLGDPFGSFRLTLAGLPCPKVGITDHRRGLDIVIGTHQLVSSVSA